MYTIYIPKIICNYLTKGTQQILAALFLATLCDVVFLSGGREALPTNTAVSIFVDIMIYINKYIVSIFVDILIYLSTNIEKAALSTKPCQITPLLE